MIAVVQRKRKDITKAAFTSIINTSQEIRKEILFINFIQRKSFLVNENEKYIIAYLTIIIYINICHSINMMEPQTSQPCCDHKRIKNCKRKNYESPLQEQACKEKAIFIVNIGY